MIHNRLFGATFACVLFLVGLSAANALDLVSKTPGTTDVVASQGAVTLTQGEIDAYARTIPEDRRAGFFSNPQRIQTAILNLLFDKQLAAEARKLGIEKDPAVQTQIQLAENSALAKARMQRFIKEIEVPDMGELAREEYTGHKEKYGVPARIDVEHVLISIKDDDEKVAMEKAGQVLEKAKAQPDKFEELVQEYSDDPSKLENNGLITNADSKQMAPPFAAAARELKKIGEISPVVKTRFGFHVLKLVAREPARVLPFDEVSDKIITQLRDQYIKKQTSAYTDGLRNLPIDANAEAVAALRTRYQAPAAAGTDGGTGVQ